MTQTVVVQELVIIIAAKNHKPTILNPDFLKYTGIVPTEWELARTPVYTNSVAQVTFTNGISIVAEPNRVMFIEAIEGKAATAVEVPAIARKYVESLPKMEYQGVGLNARGYVPFAEEQNAARNYITGTLLSPGPWKEEGTAPVGATLNFAYTLERGPLNLSVSEAALRRQDETTTPIVLFSGNFTYEIAGNSESERLSSLYQALENWQVDLKTYEEIVNTKFLAKVSENKDVVPDVVPDLFAMSASAAV